MFSAFLLTSITYAEPITLEKQSAGTLEFIDIELPLSPGVDWIFWLEMGGLVLFGLFLGLALFWLRRLVWGSLKAQAQVKAQLAKLEGGSSDKDIKLALKQLNQSFQYAKKQSFLTEAIATDLSEQFNLAVFSQQAVSRETAIEMARQYLNGLQSNQRSLGFVFRCLLKSARNWLGLKFSFTDKREKP